MPEAEVFFMMFMASTTGLALMTGLFVWKALRLRRVELELARLQGRIAVVEAPVFETAGESRLAQLEQSHDAMAAQLDRVLDGQEFLTRVLADRAESPRKAASRGSEVNTPH